MSFSRMLVIGLLLTAAGCGGQSGNEGELPAAPCAWDRALVVGRIETIGSGCVSVKVERIVKPAESTRQDAEIEVGSLLRGRSRRVYSYTHEFEAGEPVAAIAYAEGLAQTALELFPLRGDRAEVHWGKQRLQVELDVIAADSCSETLEARRENTSDVVEGGGGSHQTTPVAPAMDEPMCEP